MKALPVALACLLLASACSDDANDAKPSPSTPNVDAGPVKETPANGPGARFATYVILGDSISDAGGEGPHFHDLVGQDLNAKLGSVRIEKHSKKGAVSADLLGQVQQIPTDLPGPVAVSVTIGGNDMQRAAVDIFTGLDDEEVAKLQANIVAAYDVLLAENHFGPGVKVTIFHGSMYDPTDGNGNFAEAGCPGYMQQIPKMPTTDFWTKWNGAAFSAIEKYGANVVVVPVYEKYHGHGVGTADSWFLPDCAHPNKAGNEGLRQVFMTTMQPGG